MKNTLPRKLQDLLTDLSDREKKLVLSAYEAADEALQGKMRSNSHPFIEHPLAVAHIVCREIGLRADAVTAADPNRDSKLGESKVEGRDHFGSISEVTDWTRQLRHAEKIGMGSRKYKLVKVEN